MKQSLHEHEVQRIFLQTAKWKKPKIITKYSTFLKVKPTEHQFLTIFKC